MGRPKKKESTALNIVIDVSISDRLEEFCEESGLTKTKTVERALEAENGLLIPNTEFQTGEQKKVLNIMIESRIYDKLQQFCDEFKVPKTRVVEQSLARYIEKDKK